MKFYKLVGLSIVTCALLTGCTSKFKEMNESLDRNSKDDIVVYEQPPAGQTQSENDIINGQLAKKSLYSFSREEVVMGDPDEIDYPPRELMIDVDGMDIHNTKLGDIIRLLTSDLQNSAVVYEPNVDPSIIINMKSGKMKLYHLVKLIGENAGYNVYYSAKKKSLVISPFKTMKYRIPAGIFIDKKISVSLGNTKGSSSGSVDLNSDNPSKVFQNNINSLGSQNKIVTFDKDTGVLIVKEHPIYMDEITNFVVDYVQDRSKKYIVEMAIVDVTLSGQKNRSFDLGAVLKSGSSIYNLGSLGGAAGTGFVLTGGKGSTSTPTANVSIPGGNGVNFDAVVNMINTSTDSQIVERGKSVIANHSLQYIGNLTTKKYVSDVKTTTSGTSDVVSYETSRDTIENGVQFIARVDGYKAKDYIDVSLAPVMKAATLEKVSEVNGIAIYDQSQQAREMLSNASIKSGDVIVVGGLIRDAVSQTESSNPMMSWIPLMGSKTKTNEKVETIFIIKVSEMTDIKQSYDIPSSMTKSVVEDKM